jgi:RNA polymerase sigma factor (TIGR02999 family)
MLRWYEELKRVAHAMVRKEHHGMHTTELAHEVWLRHARRLPERIDPVRDYPLICDQVRRTLIDLARERSAQKRGSAEVIVPFDNDFHHVDGYEQYLSIDDYEALHAALAELGTKDARQRSVVEMRIFGGSSLPQIAEALGVGLRTVEGDWKFAKAWLRKRLSGSG